MKYHSLLPPSWLTAWESFQRQCFRIDQPQRLDIETIFEEWGDWGIWTFASPKDVSVLEQSSDAYGSLDVGYAARQADKWNYAITIDLDGGLIGFLQASPEFDQFYAKLTSIQDD
ncbi:MAG: hypothetical protein IID41_00315 [Planctomycetes bacterium]|nr:hypothetical protein [Planctomycetota bacterium]